ncbi:MAG: acyltransferase family protein, partial [Myxococcales bacterium]|nr:acyltransferase family protein [Myxococcales bacterium]
MNSAGGRIATLDGMRAVSIALVLAAHASGTGVIPMSAFAHLFGDLGVRTFFLISGFLITTLLLRERANTGRISLRDFYIRRVFRIFPAFYSYLALVVVVGLFACVALNLRDVAFAATYTMNFHGERSWPVGHLWSLAVEEQFYLIWPLAVIALGLVRASSFAIIAVAAAPMIRVALWYLFPQYRALADQAFPCVFDTLAMGCLLAIARSRLESWRPYRILLHATWFWIVPLVCVLTLIATRPWFQLGIGMTVANIGIAMAVHRCVSRPHSIAGRVLEHPILIQIGTLSYSLYLWQQPFLDRHSHAWFTAFPINIGLAAAAAVLCHRLIEQPMLRVSSRYRASYRQGERRVVDPVTTFPSTFHEGAGRPPVMSPMPEKMTPTVETLAP